MAIAFARGGECTCTFCDGTGRDGPRGIRCMFCEGRGFWDKERCTAFKQMGFDAEEEAELEKLRSEVDRLRVENRQLREEIDVLRTAWDSFTAGLGGEK